ncbi:hypothetical protein [Bradyrhizobium sp. 30]|uniref:hypothetical protein n=1 Tax=Bradyrhizobium sp. 30 TaxID=2782669 RepID=UPI001FF760E0|nr:hypothetical protein [Bradyrhizobium sp. 30]MCK1293419.1 hypothetical protein [Bradyrhizobium sp. 30]
MFTIDQDELEGDLPVPAHVAWPEDGGFFPDDDRDEIYRALVTPEMRGGLEPHQREMLVNFQADVRRENDPFNSERLMSRMATMVSFGAVPLPVILEAFAEAVKDGPHPSAAWGISAPEVKAPPKRNLPFHERYSTAHMYLADFRNKNARNRVTPAFNFDEYGAMAAYIHNRDLEALTALNEREFFYNDEAISTHHVNSIIDARLRSCEIWDPHRGVAVAVSNRLINEVRGAMARMWPRVINQSPDNSDKYLRLSGPGYAQRVASFGDSRTCLDADAWTSSAVLLRAWQDFCASRSEPSGASSTFFKELTRWSGGRIQRSKKGKGPHRVPGYSGIKLI